MSKPEVSGPVHFVITDHLPGPEKEMMETIAFLPVARPVVQPRTRPRGRALSTTNCRLNDAFAPLLASTVASLGTFVPLAPLAKLAVLVASLHVAGGRLREITTWTPLVLWMHGDHACSLHHTTSAIS